MRPDENTAIWIEKNLYQIKNQKVIRWDSISQNGRNSTKMGIKSRAKNLFCGRSVTFWHSESYIRGEGGRNGSQVTLYKKFQNGYNN